MDAILLGLLSGKASLDENGKIPASQLPSYVDDVEEFNSKSKFPKTGEKGKIYVAIDTNSQYRWSGSDYIEIVSKNILESIEKLEQRVAKIEALLETSLAGEDSVFTVENE
jgi:hypothetical protein